MPHAGRSRKATGERARIEQAVALAAGRARAVYDPRARWADRVRAGLDALLELAEEKPELARLCVAQALVGRRAHPGLDRALKELAQIIDHGRSAPGASKQPPSLAAQSVLGGALGLIYARLISGEERPLMELRNPLMATIVLPYLGPGAARREQLGRQRVRQRARPNGTRSGERAQLGTRLTYRTMRVLAVIAAQPGLSNSDVAGRAGITDQGQVSKLLARLKRLELIENTGAGQAMGAANAWRLTPEGRELQRKTGRISAYVTP
jgi:DNA-binding MarR family transcriptional regulator